MTRIALYSLVFSVIMPLHAENTESLDTLVDQDNQQELDVTATRKKCKKFKKVAACSLKLSNSFTLNSTTITSLPSTFGSLIPFSSGTNATTSIPTSTTPYVMGFGNGRTVISPTTQQGAFTQFAFTVPANGTINSLQASVDSAYNTIPVGPQSYTFTLYTSPSANGPITNYIPTTLTATVTYNSITATGASIFFTAASSGTGGPITVNQGDRLVVVVTPSAANTQADINNLGFSAGVIYSAS